MPPILLEKYLNAAEKIAQGTEFCEHVKNDKTPVVVERVVQAIRG